MSSTSAVQYHQVKKSYGDFEALKSIEFEIEAGQFFGLLGPNGAGKSTLINATAGLVIPTSGRIEVMGYDVQADYRVTRRLLGLVPQELIADPFFSIKELLTIQSGYFGLKGPEQKQWIEELLERLSLSDKANAPTHELSGGMKRRVLIAMALVHKPQVIVLDEPTAGVDVDLRHTLWTFAQELHQQGHTIILTTHYLEEAEALCEKVAIMQQGELKALDSTQALLQRHHYRYLRVKFPHPPDVWPEMLLERLVEIDAAGALFKIEKSLPLEQMLAWLSQAGLPIEDISSRDASLEEVFLDLVGEK
jgi:ABC-2 type transport system ATP-binding protein